MTAPLIEFDCGDFGGLAGLYDDLVPGAEHCGAKRGGCHHHRPRRGGDVGRRARRRTGIKKRHHPRPSQRTRVVADGQCLPRAGGPSLPHQRRPVGVRLHDVEKEREIVVRQWLVEAQIERRQGISDRMIRRVIGSRRQSCRGVALDHEIVPTQRLVRRRPGRAVDIADRDVVQRRRAG